MIPKELYWMLIIFIVVLWVAISWINIIIYKYTSEVRASIKHCQELLDKTQKILTRDKQ